MIRSAIERVYAVAVANYASDLAALCAAAGIAAPTVQIYPRRAAARFHPHTAAGLGIYHFGGASARRKPGAATGAGIRETRVMVALEWYLAGPNEELVLQQTELAVQAMLRAIVDEIPDGEIWGAGDVPGSVTWELELTPLAEERPMAECLVRMRVPVSVRETAQ